MNLGKKDVPHVAKRKFVYIHKCMHAMYIANYGYFLNIHDDIIMDLIVGLKNLEGYTVG